jgi:hypothetical protein
MSKLTNIGFSHDNNLVANTFADRITAVVRALPEELNAEHEYADFMAAVARQFPPVDHSDVWQLGTFEAAMLNGAGTGDRLASYLTLANLATCFVSEEDADLMAAKSYIGDYSWEKTRAIPFFVCDYPSVLCSIPLSVHDLFELSCAASALAIFNKIQPYSSGAMGAIISSVLDRFTNSRYLPEKLGYDAMTTYHGDDYDRHRVIDYMLDFVTSHLSAGRLKTLVDLEIKLMDKLTGLANSGLFGDLAPEDSEFLARATCLFLEYFMLIDTIADITFDKRPSSLRQEFEKRVADQQADAIRIREFKEMLKREKESRENEN